MRIELAGTTLKEINEMAKYWETKNHKVELREAVLWIFPPRPKQPGSE